MTRLERCRIFLALALFITACSSPTTTASNAPAPTPPTVASTPTRPSLPTPSAIRPPTATPEPEDTGWRELALGVQERRLWAETALGRERLWMLRLDPDQVRLRVVYEPAHPRRVSEWAALSSKALVVVNAGYFTPEMQATGLLVSDGTVLGRSYGDFAGMLAVAADGQITLRWLRTWPYRPDEALAQAVQSFPVLVKPGNVMGFPPDADQGQRSRRTVVAQDTGGRIIVLVSLGPRLNLHELAVWLTESDLELDIALNLDGGTSTGLWVRGLELQVDSLVPVPAVIVFDPAGE